MKKRFDIASEDDPDVAPASERALLIAILKRAILDYLSKSSEFPKTWGVKRTREEIAEHFLGVQKKFQASKMKLKDFAEKEGFSIYWYKYHFRKYRKPKPLPWMPAKEWLFDDERDDSEPFSFNYVLYHLYKNPESMKKWIREILKSEKKAVLEKYLT